MNDIGNVNSETLIQYREYFQYVDTIFGKYGSGIPTRPLTTASLPFRQRHIQHEPRPLRAGKYTRL